MIPASCEGLKLANAFGVNEFGVAGLNQEDA
jgi:hypothetical protein